MNPPAVLRMSRRRADPNGGAAEWKFYMFPRLPGFVSSQRQFCQAARYHPDRRTSDNREERPAAKAHRISQLPELRRWKDAGG